MTTINLCDGLTAAIVADPEAWGDLVLQGAKAAGLPLSDLRELVVAGTEALDLLEAGDEPDPRRLKLYWQIAAGGIDLVHRFAMIGAGTAGGVPRTPCHA